MDPGQRADIPSIRPKKFLRFRRGAAILATTVLVPRPAAPSFGGKMSTGGTVPSEKSSGPTELGGYMDDPFGVPARRDACRNHESLFGYMHGVSATRAAWS